ncbi:MAG: ATP synthase F1 subunit epsilon [Pseudomonadota bacterium]
MADRLHFSLVSPERELFAGEAEAVLVPGTEGLFEVRADHSAVMTTLSPGVLVIKQSGGEKKFYVRGGFADVTAAGLTVLAEVAIPEDELSGDVLGQEKMFIDQQRKGTLSAEEMINANRAADVLAAY